MYMIPHQISANLNNIKSQPISSSLNAYIAVNSQQILVKLTVYDTTPNLDCQPILNEVESCKLQQIWKLELSCKLELSWKLGQSWNLELSWMLELSWKLEVI